MNFKVCMNHFWFNQYSLIKQCYEEERHLDTLYIDNIKKIKDGILIRFEAVDDPVEEAPKVLYDWFKQLCERMSEDGRVKSSVIKDCQDAHTIQSSQVCQKSNQDFEVDIYIGYDD